MQLTLALVAFIAISMAPSVDCYARFTEKVPNGGAVANAPALGHVNLATGGGDRNAFGRAFAAAGFRWTTELCEADTDQDGQTNGQELGDPCCSWVETGNLAYIRGVADPSDPTSRVNPIIFSGIQCTKSEEAVEAANQQAKKAATAKKSKAATPVPVPAMMDEEEDGDAYESGSNSTSSSLQKDGETQDATTTGTSAAGRHYGSLSTAAALAVGLAVAWATALL